LGLRSTAQCVKSELGHDFSIHFLQTFKMDSQFERDIGSVLAVTSACESCRTTAELSAEDVLAIGRRHARVCVLKEGAEELPKQDQFTTYDYELGDKRRAGVEHNGLHLEVNQEAGRFPRLKGHIDFSVLGNTELHSREDLDLACLGEKQVRDFGVRSLARWGKGDAEKVLSATSTGSLYFNIVFRYGSFAEFCRTVGF
jgi:hypothetical protein